MLKVCVKCAKCNPVCPTFLQSFDEAYSPRGYLHFVSLLGNQKIQNADELLDILEACTLCGDCEPVCPINLPIVTMIAQAQRLHKKTP